MFTIPKTHQVQLPRRAGRPRTKSVELVRIMMSALDASYPPPIATGFSGHTTVTDFSGLALSKTVDTTDGSRKSEPTPFSPVSPVAPINAGALKTDISVFLVSPTGPVGSSISPLGPRGP